MVTESVKILLVEDNPADARLISECFSESRETSFLISTAASIAAAVELIFKQNFDVILLDLSLPDSHGLETLHQMHAHAPDLPIIVLTGHDDDELALAAMRHGAQDFLLKGDFDFPLLNRAIRYTIERKHAESEIKKLAYYDTLTDLPNRLLFIDRLRQAIVQAERDKRSAALLFLDLDHFKRVNDTLGHAYGDRLLKIAAERILSCLRITDTVARLGGDEFVVVLPMVAVADDVVGVAAKILDSLKNPVEFDGNKIYTSTSIGISLYPNDGVTVDELLKNADIAMYQAKEHGRNNYQFFSPEMNEKAIIRQRIEANLRHGIACQQFFLQYQPQLDINSGAIVGFEALVRWNCPEIGIVPPNEFIQVAEETGLILALGDWVLATACRQAKEWLEQFNSDLRIAVNISARQFKQEDFVGKVVEILRQTGLPATNLELELTESVIMEQADRNISALKKLKMLGVRLAIDDFGTGYSSLSYLKHFPIDRLKIDRSFVKDIPFDSDDAAIAEAIIVMAHSLKLNVVAEGVEKHEQLEFLQSHSCDEFQGFLLSRPLSANDATKLLASQTDSGNCLDSKPLQPLVNVPLVGPS